MNAPGGSLNLSSNKLHTLDQSMHTLILQSALPTSPQQKKKKKKGDVNRSQVVLVDIVYANRSQVGFMDGSFATKLAHHLLPAALLN